MIRCLIVEDEKILRKGLILTTEWKEHSCEVVGEAANGAEALKLIKELSPDLVITDIKLPIMGGLDLIEKAREISDVEFIIISGYNDFSYTKKAIHLGVAEYITKPIEEEELYETLDNVVRKIKKKGMNLENILAPELKYKGITISTKNRYILQAMKYIEENYEKNISMKDVCKSLLISESYLTKLFKNHTDYSFVDYLTGYRMQKACELLNDSTLRIYAIAEAVGYRDQRYFSVLFKKYVGVTPREYRENYL